MLVNSDFLTFFFPHKAYGISGSWRETQKYQTVTEMCEFYPFWATQPGLGSIPRRRNLTLPKCLISNGFFESYGKIETSPLVEGSCLKWKEAD